jgi:hypothetical protein
MTKSNLRDAKPQFKGDPKPPDIHEARTDGRIAYWKDISVDKTPERFASDATLADAWQAGWREGEQEKKDLDNLGAEPEPTPALDNKPYLARERANGRGGQHSTRMGSQAKGRKAPETHDSPLDGLQSNKGNGAGKQTQDSGKKARPQPRIRWQVLNADPDFTVAQLRDLLASAGCFFERGVPVMLAYDQSLGGLVAHPVTAEMVMLETHERSRPWQLDREGKEKNCPLPRGIAVMYLKWLGQWRLPVLNGIASSPLLSNDGGIRTAAGYDERTGLWCENVPDVADKVPERPTKEQAAKSLLAIRRFFRTFCFADAETIEKDGIPCVKIDKPPGLDESGFLNALLTAVCRPSLKRAPGVVTNAPLTSGSGTGKGLLMRAICEIAFGEQPSAITPGPSPEETEKRIATELIGARQSLLLDNLNNMTFESHQLNSAMTEDLATIRNFGALKNLKVNSKAFVMLNGNGLTISGDSARRFMHIELDAKIEDPESRELDTEVFQDRVRECRSELLAHLLTIWRYGRRARFSREERGLPIGSFEQWARWVRDPLLVLGCLDPVKRVAEMKAKDPHRLGLTAIFDQWDKCHGSDEVTAWELKDAVKELLIEDKDKRTRQAIAGSVNRLVKARVAGYVLHRIASPEYDRWQPARFKLEKKDVEKQADDGDLPF